MLVEVEAKSFISSRKSYKSKKLGNCILNIRPFGFVGPVANAPFHSAVSDFSNFILSSPDSPFSKWCLVLWKMELRPSP